MSARSKTDSDYAAVITTPLPGGVRLGLTCENGVLVSIDLLQAGTALKPATEPQVQRVVDALNGYFENHGKVMNMPPLKAHGTPFQHRVWLALLDIPPGHTQTYGELAKGLGSSARAVASACKANPIPFLVPCHRVVAAQGLGGYMGQVEGEGIAIKQWLLRHEGAL